MKKLRVKCIIFTSDCLRHQEFAMTVYDSLLDILQSKDIALIFIEDEEDFTTNWFSYFSSKDSNCQVIYCKYQNKSWDIFQNLTRIFVSQNLLIEELVQLIQTHFYISPENTITIGADRQNLLLKNRSVLHFYVGQNTQLSHKVRGLIPLTGQYEYGLLNIITYFSNQQFIDEVIDYHDLIKFIDDSYKFYASGRAVYELHRKHGLVTQCLREKFKDEIVAIFATGFPFYLLDGGLNSEDDLSTKKTPDSILNYFKIQISYFTSKMADKKFFFDNKNISFNIQDLEKINIFPFLNRFDAYKYEKMGYPAPLLEKKKRMSLEDYYFDNCFDISTDVWPCYYCSTLQNPDLFPDQLVRKNTNISCLPCKQTSFKLRNIMGHSPDLDMVVVARKGKCKLAENIQNYITREANYHLYDTNFHKIFNENDGPVDLFVTDLSELTLALEELTLLDDWEQLTFDSIALWSPNIQHSFQLGIDFALAFEPIILNDSQLRKTFFLTRQKFVTKHGVDKIMTRLSTASFYSVFK